MAVSWCKSVALVGLAATLHTAAAADQQCASGNCQADPDVSSMLQTQSGRRGAAVLAHEVERVECDEALEGNGEGYRGCQIQTRSGATCQAWSAQFPQLHIHTAESYAEAGLEENYCRNPDAAEAVWCYTTGRARWEFCDPLGNTTEATTTTTVATTTTTVPVTTQTSEEDACVDQKSLGKCEPCLHSKQCGGDRYCCPWMKKCVLSGEGCSYPIADCSPRCHARTDTEAESCTCAVAGFPFGWQKKTCQADATTTTVGPGGAKVHPREWEHFGLLNQLRAAGYQCPTKAGYPDAYEANLVPLKFDCRLWKAAQLHSEDMSANNYFSHSSQDGRSPWTRARAQNIRANGENIAAGRASAADILDMWKASKGHCHNMMKPAFTAIGVGYGPGGRYRHYWTQMFANDAGELDTSCYPEGAPSFVQQHNSSANETPPAAPRSSSDEDDEESDEGDAPVMPPMDDAWTA